MLDLEKEIAESSRRNKDTGLLVGAWESIYSRQAAIGLQKSMEACNGVRYTLRCGWVESVVDWNADWPLFLCLDPEALRQMILGEFS